MRTDLLAADVDVDELIREAQGEARAAVKARLRAQFEDALMRAADARLAVATGEEAAGSASAAEEAAARAAPAEEATPSAAPPAPVAETGDGLWLYCVTARGDAPDVPGVAEEHAPRVITAAGLKALVSDVPLADFGEDGLKRNLNDLPWLEAVARAHELVLERTLENAAVVPMRLCTIYRSEKQVQALLAERREQFTEVLAALEGRGEWGVKITADRERVAERLRARAEQRPA